MKKTLIGAFLCAILALFTVSCSEQSVQTNSKYSSDETIGRFLEAMNDCNLEEAKMYIVNGESRDLHGIYNAEKLIDYYKSMPDHVKPENPQENVRLRPFSLVPSREDCKENLGAMGDEYYEFMRSIYVRMMPTDRRIVKIEKIDDDELLYTIEYSVIDQSAEDFGGEYEDEIENLKIKYRDEIKSKDPDRMQEYIKESLRYSKLAYDDFFANAQRKTETEQIKVVDIDGKWYVDYELIVEPDELKISK